MANVRTVTNGTVGVEGSEGSGDAINDALKEETNKGALSTMEQLEIFERDRQKMEKVSFADALKDSVTAESGVERLNKEKKDSLVGVPFIITGIRVNQGNYGPFVSITGVDQNERNFVLNDGSTGIAAQMLSLVEQFGMDKPIFIKNGLRKSTYYVDKTTLKVVGKEPTANSFEAATYYLDI